MNMKRLRDLLSKIRGKRSLPVKEGVEYSIKKYNKTYKLLEEYDKKATKNPQDLVDAGRLRKFIQSLQRKDGSRRAYPSV